MTMELSSYTEFSEKLHHAVISRSIPVNGTIEVSNGATATLEDEGNNAITGQITATNATLNLNDNWTNHGAIAADSSPR